MATTTLSYSSTMTDGKLPSHPSQSSRPITPKSPSPIRSRATPPRISSPTAVLIRSSPRQCYLCDEQNPGDFSPTTKFLSRCLLCSRDFCPVHHASQYPDRSVCNINHSTYYHSCLDEARKFLSENATDQRPIRDREVEDLVLQDGVFPSIGEKEKAVFIRSPVSQDQIRQIAELRALDAVLSGTKGQRPSSLIETRSFIGADIAA